MAVVADECELVSVTKVELCRDFIYLIHIGLTFLCFARLVLRTTSVENLRLRGKELSLSGNGLCEFRFDLAVARLG